MGLGTSTSKQTERGTDFTHYPIVDVIIDVIVDVIMDHPTAQCSASPSLGLFDKHIVLLNIFSGC